MMRTDEVAIWLGLTEHAVREAVKRGDLRAVRKGSILRIRRDELISESAVERPR